MPWIGEKLDPNHLKKQLGNNKKGLYLFKLHGSLGWRKHEHLDDTIVKLPASERHKNSVLIYPTKIKSPRYPFLNLYEQFFELLQQAKELIVIGCSLRDELLKDHIFHAHQKNPKLSIKLCDPIANTLQDELNLPNCETYEVRFGDTTFLNIFPKKFTQDIRKRPFAEAIARSKKAKKS